MAINLRKGQSIDLRKNEKGENFDLSRLTIGLGWDIQNKNLGSSDFDLDAIAFVLDSNSKIASLGRTVEHNGNKYIYIGSDIIYFYNQKHPSGLIKSTGDNRTGDGDGDDEQIILLLDALDKKYQSVLFLVTIYKGVTKNQHFGQIDNAFIRALDSKGKEIVRYNLSKESSLNGMCSMVFAEITRKGDGWEFRAIGDPHKTDDFTDLLLKYTY